jgi:hypothetical protein
VATGRYWAVTFGLLLELPTLRYERGQRAREYALSAWKAEDHVGRLLQVFQQAGAR